MRTLSGIPGLDAILSGGFPTDRTVVVMGGAGTGKTVMGMQFLAQGAALYGEPGLMLSFEESPEKLSSDFASLTGLPPEVLSAQVTIVDGRLPDNTVGNGDFDLSGLLAIIELEVQRRGIKRIVADGIDNLFAVSRDADIAQREITRFLSWLNTCGATALVTVKARHDVAEIPTAFAFAEFAADGVLVLRSDVSSELQRRVLRVVKLRGSAFVNGDHAYSIGNAGLRVLYAAPRTRLHPGSFVDRCSTGIERLDRMLEGGYRRGTTTLISGLPGASKTTLGASFLAAGCAAGERGLFIGFDEPAEQMVIDVNSVSIDLEQYRQSGLLRTESYAAGSAIADQHYLNIEALVDEHQPLRVVIDPVSALLKSGGSAIAELVSERLVTLLKSRGITVVFTAVSEAGAALTLEGTPMRISTIADTWIHLSFASRGGERNRTLTVVKSRGTAHSPQMREILISKSGVTLDDVYSVDGEVLFGTARAYREQQTHADMLRQERALAADMRRLDGEHSTVVAEAQAVQTRLVALAQRRSELQDAAEALAREGAVSAMLLRERRRPDPEALQTI